MPLIFDGIILFCAHSTVMTADIERVFLQIGIKTQDRDLLRFLWVDNIRKENPP